MAWWNKTIYVPNWYWQVLNGISVNCIIYTIPNIEQLRSVYDLICHTLTIFYCKKSLFSIFYKSLFWYIPCIKGLPFMKNSKWTIKQSYKLLNHNNCSVYQMMLLCRPFKLKTSFHASLPWQWRWLVVRIGIVCMATPLPSITFLWGIIDENGGDHRWFRRKIWHCSLV